MIDITKSVSFVRPYPQFNSLNKNTTTPVIIFNGSSLTGGITHFRTKTYLASTIKHADTRVMFVQACLVFISYFEQLAHNTPSHSLKVVKKYVFVKVSRSERARMQVIQQGWR